MWAFFFILPKFYACSLCAALIGYCGAVSLTVLPAMLRSSWRFLPRLRAACDQRAALYSFSRFFFLLRQSWLFGCGAIGPQLIDRDFGEPLRQCFQISR